MLKLTILTSGNKMPPWVTEACAEYSKRLQEFTQLQCVEIPLVKRSKTSDLARIVEKETALLNAAVPQNAYVIALDIPGETMSSEKMAAKLDKLKHSHSHLCFLIGGPEGLSPSIINRCQERWSLSALTLPHPLVRIVLLEALYRAFSITANHPYHK